MKLNEFLKKSRLLENYSQKEFAERLGVSFVTYNNLENGNTKPSYKTINKIHKYFGLDIQTIREML